MMKNNFRLLLTVVVIFAFSFQISAQENSKGRALFEKLEAEYNQRQKEKKELYQLEMEEVDLIGEKEVVGHEKEIEALELAEMIKTKQAIAKLRIIERARELREKGFKLGSKVAILGDSAVAFSEEGFDSDVLSDLLELIKTSQPQAVFFAGNLVYSLIPTDDEKAPGSKSVVEIPTKKTVFGRQRLQEEGVFDPQAFKSTLESFSAIVKQSLGPNIAFYPIMGLQEAVGADAAEIFKNQFGLTNATIFESGQLAYTVPIGNALFIAISTDYFDKKTQQPTEYTISPEVFTWLEQTLASEHEKYPFIFIIGSDPAFSTSAVFNVFQGLDQSKPARDRLWDLLQKYQVRAYISAGEVLYDRTYRRGIWHIISGGAGTPRDYFNYQDDTFFHYLLLNISNSPVQDPHLEVMDIYGIVRDEVQLSKSSPLLFDFRITRDR
jgi:hypothetical protein